MGWLVLGRAVGAPLSRTYGGGHVKVQPGLGEGKEVRAVGDREDSAVNYIHCRTRQGLFGAC